jgi:hypothetical protein
VSVQLLIAVHTTHFARTAKCGVLTILPPTAALYVVPKAAIVGCHPTLIDTARTVSDTC